MTELPDGIDLAYIAKPGDVVVLRLTKAKFEQAALVSLVQELINAHEMWGVRFVLLDDRYFEVFTGKDEDDD